MEQVERQMYVMKLMLVLMRDRKAKQGQVRSVGYIREYGEMPDEMGVYSLGQFSDEQIIALSEELGVKKRPDVGKSDIYMNDLGYALAWSEASIVLVDQAGIEDLIALAQKLQLPEDIVHKVVAWHQQQAENSVMLARQTANPFNEHRKAWEKLIAYWFSQGTANELSNFPADYVLSFEEALNMNTWEIYEPERYVELVWEHIQFRISKEQKLTVVVSK